MGINSTFAAFFALLHGRVNIEPDYNMANQEEKTSSTELLRKLLS